MKLFTHGDRGACLRGPGRTFISARTACFPCIREIRAALGDDKRQVVRVISGRGYLFQTEVSAGGGPGRQTCARRTPAHEAYCRFLNATNLLRASLAGLPER